MAISNPPIFVVDDDADDTYFLRRALKGAGILNPVIGCDDGEDAVRFLEAAKFGGQQPCLIFVDLKMPRMDGFEFLSWIRSHPEFQDLKVVVLSSSARDEDRERAYSLGAHAYLVKFPDSATLLRELSTALADCAS